MEIPTDKPSVKLIGKDGNAFIIMGRCSGAAKRAGWTKEQVDAVMGEMQNGDYDNLLCTVMKYFDVN